MYRSFFTIQQCTNTNTLMLHWMFRTCFATQWCTNTKCYTTCLEHVLLHSDVLFLILMLHYMFRTCFATLWCSISNTNAKFMFRTCFATQWCTCWPAGCGKEFSCS